MSERYRLHGLNVRSEIPLFQRRPALDGADDLVLEWGPEREVAPDRPDGAVVAEAVFGGQRLYSVVEATEGYTARFHGTCDFAIDAGLSRVTCRADPAGPAASIPVIAAGTLLASVLVLRGHVVLHASAVQVGDVALAFVGRSGMGKSTLTALFTRRGAPLIGDDVLRVDLDGGVARCRLGTTEIRLRPAARDLVAQAAATAARETGDGRTGLTPPASLVDGLPLAAVVVPLPSRDRDRAELVPLTPRDAVLQLARYPRVLGWTHPRTSAQQFALLAEMAGMVPMYRAVVPWGPPFRDDVVDELLEGLGLSPAHPAAAAVPVPSG